MTKHQGFWLHSFFSISSCLLLLTPTPLFAWSKTGHHIIVQIARQYMPSSVSDSVQKYLGAMSFEDASIWMDDVKYKKGFTNMKTWHYVNIEKDQTYVASESPNIINQLQLALYNLTAHKGDKITVQFNLKVLFHLLGDLHQPLHVGYGYDRGGNDTEVMYFKRSTNLHYVWDDLIIKTGNISAESCLKLAKTLPLESKIDFDSSMILLWANESRLLLDKVYTISDNYIAHAYINRNVPIIELQLLKAGIRTAELLKQVFSQN